MGERNVNEQRRPLPEKIERRLTELVTMEEFDAGEVAWCRRAYWGARYDWHQILIACFEAGQRRISRGEKVVRAAK